MNPVVLNYSHHFQFRFRSSISLFLTTITPFKLHTNRIGLAFMIIRASTCFYQLITSLDCDCIRCFAGMLILVLVLVLVLKDSLRTFFKSLSLSLGVRSLSLSLSLGVRVQEILVLVLVLGGQVLVLILVLVV